MTGGDEGDDATVLVVDDEEKLADMYTLWLRDQYDVRTVYEGQAFLSEVDEDVDVVLLDLRMPGYSGEEVLEKLRLQDPDVSVIVVTAVDPDVDILEMPFDDYLCKPVRADDLIEAIDNQLLAREHNDELREYLQLTTKRRLLALEHPERELEDNEEWVELNRRRNELEDLLRRTIDDFEGVLEAYESINRAPGKRGRS